MRECEGSGEQNGAGGQDRQGTETSAEPGTRVSPRCIHVVPL